MVHHPGSYPGLSVTGEKLLMPNPAVPVIGNPQVYVFLANGPEFFLHKFPVFLSP